MEQTRQKRWYEKNKLQILKRMRDKYVKNRDSVLETRKMQRESRTDADKLKDCIYLREYRKINKEEIKNSRKRLEYRYSQYRTSANRRGYTFELSIVEFDSITKSTCEYCGLNSGGIDRVDNQLGYIEGNVVPCCEMCNKMKWRWSKDEFISHSALIAKHNKR